MTILRQVQFDPLQCAVELDEFARLLSASPSLPERRVTLPFFRQRAHLATLLGVLHPRLATLDRLAYELRLFGSFGTDIIVGDSEKRTFCLIEFEEGAPESVFAHGRRGTSLWSPRFEHGFSQIVDWFWKLDDLRGTAALTEVFGAPTIDVAAVLVIGRDAGLSPTDRERLVWRRRHVLVNSQQIYCCTFDELERDLRQRLFLFTGQRRAE